MTVCATPCGHVFHFDCVSDWVDEHRHCPQCRQRVLSSSRLVTLYFAHEKKSSSAGTLRNALPTRHDVWDNTLNHENSGGGGVGSDDTAVIMDVMQCQLDDLDSECQKLRKALARSEEQLRATAEELRVIEAQQDGALDIKAISRELDMVRAEQDDLQRTSQHLREEIAILNENIGKKDLEIRQKDAAYEYLLGRNAILLEQTETNERLVSSLRAQIQRSSSVDSLYERVNGERSLSPQSTTDTQVPSNRGPRHKGCFKNMCKCFQNTAIIIFILVIVIGIFVIFPLSSIFASNNDK